MKKRSLVILHLFFVCFCVYTSSQDEVTCTVPTIKNAKTLKKPGTNIEYQCLHGHEPDRFVITCNQKGDWDNMRDCTATTLDCGRPPQIEHAVQDFKDRYENGEKAAYDCPALYVKEGDLTCTRGRWAGSGKCWKPCTVDLKAMDDRNIQLRHKYTEKIYSTHKDFIAFSCKRGYRLVKGSVPFRQRCNNGEILLPVCEQ
ncbi:complement factor H-related protein 1-like [Colossoma macropomum]|uniref:complement factor H-related protein 1-like n=1 Tax=Colossoma macropomum TaxID=42526 RepID=UPI001863C642|nr:complement factor H-related protein 1-like [Colossoma macropomum]